MANRINLWLWLWFSWTAVVSRVEKSADFKHHTLDKNLKPMLDTHFMPKPMLDTHFMPA